MHGKKKFKVKKKPVAYMPAKRKLYCKRNCYHVTCKRKKNLEKKAYQVHACVKEKL